MPLSAFQNPITYEFTGTLATNEATATVNLPLPTRDPLWFMRAISIIAEQNLAYEFQFFTRAINMGGTLATDHFNAVWQFGVLQVGPPASPGWPINPIDTTPSNGYYHFYIDGNMMPLYDLDQLLASSRASGGTYPNNANLHVRLINRSAASFDSSLLATFYCAPQGQQV